MFDYKKLFDLSGRKAMVVGAGSGIGEAAALGLAAHGAEVICADLNAEAAARVAESIRSTGGLAGSLALDIRDAAGVLRAMDDAPDLDVLVSTPAINVRKPLLQMTEDEFDRVGVVTRVPEAIEMVDLVVGVAERVLQD